MDESSAFAAMDAPLLRSDPSDKDDREILTLLEREGQRDVRYFMLTARPDLVRGRWRGTQRFDNIALGVTVRTQADADRLIPELLGVSDLVGLLWVDLRPTEAVDLVSAGFFGCDCPDIELDNGEIEERCSGQCSFYRHSPVKLGINRWLHISGDGEPLDPNWVRKLLHDAVEAGVPVWMESIILDGRVWRQLPPWGRSR